MYCIQVLVYMQVLLYVVHCDTIARRNNHSAFSVSSVRVNQHNRIADLTPG